MKVYFITKGIYFVAYTIARNEVPQVRGPFDR